MRNVPELKSRSLAMLCALTLSVTIFGQVAVARENAVAAKPASAPGRVAVAMNVAPAVAPSEVIEASLKPNRKNARARVPGPYYVDFRARTAQTYGHAFVWYGMSSQREVEVAGLHPRGEEAFQYIVGHVLPVPSETGASYGDLDEEYLTANYRVYMNEEDAKKVFAYIQRLQRTTPFWNAATTNCTWFIGTIASYMGLRTPSHLLVPEDYVNELKTMNKGRDFVTLGASANQSYALPNEN